MKQEKQTILFGPFAFFSFETEFCVFQARPGAFSVVVGEGSRRSPRALRTVVLGMECIVIFITVLTLSLYFYCSNFHHYY